MLTQVAAQRYPLWLVRVLRITLFTVLIAISAKIRIELPGTPVPITMQVVSVLLAGMALGPIEGAISAIAYVGGIAAGMPLDARGLGPVALVGPTAGYLLSYPIAAFIAGLAWKANERYKLALTVVVGILAVIFIHLMGMVGLYWSAAQGSWLAAFTMGSVPFLIIDFGKVLLAASLVNLGHQSWLRWITPRLSDMQK